MSDALIDNEDDETDIPLLSPAPALWQTWWQLQDGPSRNALFMYYSTWLRKVTGNIMLRYHYPLAEWGDYIHLASIGLFTAIERYKPHQNTLFESYAYLCVKGQILNGLSNYTSESKKSFGNTFPSHRIEEYDEDSDPLSGVVNAVVGLALGYFLESGIHDESMHESDPLHVYQNEQESGVLRELVDQLPEREKFVIINHYLHQINFKEIAELLSMSTVRVSQLHHQALKRLRKIYEETVDN